MLDVLLTLDRFQSRCVLLVVHQHLDGVALRESLVRGGPVMTGKKGDGGQKDAVSA
jgi:hypothetical protein